jgi:hypothetical protein
VKASEAANGVIAKRNREPERLPRAKVAVEAHEAWSPRSRLVAVQSPRREARRPQPPAAIAREGAECAGLADISDATVAAVGKEVPVGGRHEHAVGAHGQEGADGGLRRKGDPLVATGSVQDADPSGPDPGPFAEPQAAVPAHGHRPSFVREHRETRIEPVADVVHDGVMLQDPSGPVGSRRHRRELVRGERRRRRDGLHRPARFDDPADGLAPDEPHRATSAAQVHPVQTGGQRERRPPQMPSVRPPQRSG